MTLMTPPMALEPQRVPWGPRRTSIRSMLSVVRLEKSKARLGLVGSLATTPSMGTGGAAGDVAGWVVGGGVGWPPAARGQTAAAATMIAAVARAQAAIARQRTTAGFGRCRGAEVMSVARVSNPCLRLQATGWKPVP